MTKTYTDFFAAMRARESSGNYAATNKFGYLGAYQFGEAALVDLGIAVRDAKPFNNIFSAGFTGKFGIDSKAEFLGSPAAQDSVASEWWTLLWNRVRYYDIEMYDQQTLNGVKLTKSGMIAASHLLGTGALIDFIESGGTDMAADGFGTRITDYLKLFASYATPVTFLNNLGRDNTINGGSKSDRLNGYAGNDALSGGAGKDTLTGGTGADTFRFKNLSDGGDVIRDFDGADTIVVEGPAFGLGDYHGVLPVSAFWRSTSNAAHDASDRFIFRTVDDTLWFDSNGNRAGGLTLVADLVRDYLMTAGDILVV